jgi:REP element-mobilizing transposase RayT
MYHLMSRGNRRQNIYLDNVDRHDFLKTLAEACQKTSWQVHACCLMSNHYHLVVETHNANLVAGMAWLQSAFTIRLNHRHKLIGHVLSGRAKLTWSREWQWLPAHGRLRRETTLSVKQIAVRLHLGTPASASLCLLGAMRKASSATPTQAWLGI